MMIDYEEVTFDLGNGPESHIRITRPDGTIEGFPAENKNPNYISFLRQLSEDNPTDPHFTAWVEAGNDPDEFWTQTDELTEPKEEI